MTYKIFFGRGHLGILDKKREARLRGSTEDWRKYKGIFKARAKQDLEN